MMRALTRFKSIIDELLLGFSFIGKKIELKMVDH